MSWFVSTVVVTFFLLIDVTYSVNFLLEFLKTPLDIPVGHHAAAVAQKTLYQFQVQSLPEKLGRECGSQPMPAYLYP